NGRSPPEGGLAHAEANPSSRATQPGSAASLPNGGAAHMHGREARRVISRKLLGSVVLLVAVGLVALVRQGTAQSTDNECLAGFQGVPEGDENGGTITCTECDPTCDQDGVTTPNGSCTFKYTACVNKPSGSCVPATLKKIKGKVQNGAS